MKGEEFRARFRVLKRLTHRGVMSYHALDSDGSLVMVHVLPGEAASAKDKLLKALERLPSSDRKRLRQVLTVESTLVLVTEPLDDFTSLGDWFVTRSGSASSAAAAPSPPPPAPHIAAEGPDEFEQLFGQQSQTPSAASPASPGPPAPGPAAPPPTVAGPPAHPAPPPPAAAKKPPGEYTLLFGASDLASPESAEEPEEEAPPARPAEPAAGDMIEKFGFTEVFGPEPGSERHERPPPPPPRHRARPVEPAPPAKPVVRWRGQGPNPSKPVPGEVYGPRPTHPKPPPPLKTPREPSGPGEFSQLFKSGKDARPPEAGSGRRGIPWRDTKEYLRALESGPQSPPTLRPSEGPPAGPPPIPPPVGPPPIPPPVQSSVPPLLPRSAGPSEYTMIHEGGLQPAAGPAGAGAGAESDLSQPAAGDDDDMYVARRGLSDQQKLMIGLGAIVVLIVIVVIISL